MLTRRVRHAFNLALLDLTTSPTIFYESSTAACMRADIQSATGYCHGQLLLRGNLHLTSTHTCMQTFSLPLAAVMGCCSFEAYNAPYVLHGVKEVSPCKTETVYMDRGFMNKLVAGVMEVRAAQAAHA